MEEVTSKCILCNGKVERKVLVIIVEAVQKDKKYLHAMVCENCGVLMTEETIEDLTDNWHKALDRFSAIKGTSADPTLSKESARKKAEREEVWRWNKLK